MTEAEKLVEECARELWYLYTTSPAWEAAEERHQETWRRYARAAISVTLDELDSRLDDLLARYPASVTEWAAAVREIRALVPKEREP